MPLARRRLVVCVLVCTIVCVAATALAQSPLTVWVVDTSGGAIPGAQVIALADGAVLAELTAGERGGAEIPLGRQTRIHVIVSAPGFETVEQDIPIAAQIPSGRAPAPVRITLAVARVTDEVVVAGGVPEAGASSFALTPAEVDALPDDEESLLKMLEELAGPGADIRVDGFTGRLPRKEQILRITVRRDAYSAELPQPGQGRVDILTRPNAEFWRGNGSVQYRPSGLAASNALAPQRGSGTYRSLSGSIAGPLSRGKTAIFLEGESTNAEDSRAISAITPAGAFVTAVDQPSDEYRMNMRLETMVRKTTLMRVTWSGEQGMRDNQGLSALDLPERGYSQESTQQSVRASVDGGTKLPYFVRVRGEYDRQRSSPDTIAQAIVVNNSFRAGGATQSGEDRNSRVDLESAVTLLTRPLTVRTGGQLIWNREVQGVVRNTLGTFTFLDLDAYRANSPATFTQRVGAQSLTIATLQAASFVQADVQLRHGWSLGLGTRYQWQTNLSDTGAVSPRVGLSRAMNQGRTTVRGGYGWYYGWLPTNVWEENLRLSQGSSEQEIVIRNPGFPDPLTSGDLDAPRQDPPSLVAIPADADLTRWSRTSVGIAHQLGGGVRANVDVYRLWTSGEWRAIDLNAPIAGVRPDVSRGRVLRVDSIGRVTETGVSMDVGFFSRERFANVRYSWARRWSDGDDGLTPPPDGQTLTTEWGPSRGDPGHRVFWSIGTPIRWGVRAGVFGRFQQGGRYNVTTGLDANGDAFFIERPDGVGRNDRRGSAQVTTDLRVSWRPAIFGAVSAQRGPGGPGPGGRGGGPGRGPGGRPERSMELYLSASNVLNRINRTSFVGVQTSSLFGQATSATAARRVELGWRFSF
jgi:hypothetical protein